MMKELNKQQLTITNGGKKKKNGSKWIECGVGTLAGGAMGGAFANPATIVGGAMMGAAGSCF